MSSCGHVDWQPAMWQRALSASAGLTRYPWAIGLMGLRTNPGPQALRHHNAVIGSFRARGVSNAGAANAFSVLDSYT